MPDNDVLQARPAMPKAATAMAQPATAIHGRWKKGQSGNPKGRPSQAPFKAAMAALRAAEMATKEKAPKKGA